MPARRTSSAGHRPGRGCGCDACENRRVKARERYNAKFKGVPINRATGQPTRDTTRNQNDKGNEPRFMESKSGDGVVVHWMPKEGEEWECPKCGRWFLKVDGKWTEPWVA